MNTVSVKASKSYKVMIGSDLLDSLGSYAKDVSKAQKVAIISDSNVWPIYGKRAENSLEQAGFVVCSYIFPAGESSKNGTTFLSILDFLAEKRLTRSDLIVALGGGVVGDIAGFSAATYLRGIPYIQVPTTLLAMVDSSVGGKTAIDLTAGKNLAGAFYQPSLVLCDIDALGTLPDHIFIDGCAEVIKYGILFDEDLFNHLAESGTAFCREAVISRCVELKRDIVAKDEFDTAARQLLNLGHTIGHGIEAESNFSISHGKAVASGTAIVARAAFQRGFCTKNTLDRILSVLKKFGLSGNTQADAETLYTRTLSDKKRSGETVNLIIPRSIGECIIHPTNIVDLKSFIEAGL